MNGSELYLNFPYFIVRHHSNSFQIELKSTYANLHFFIYTCSMFFLIKTQKMTDKNGTRNETLKIALFAGIQTNQSNSSSLFQLTNTS